MALLTSPHASLLGALHPRVEVKPAFVDSLGAEAIELARDAGLDLDYWQQQALILMLAVREDGRWACFEYGEIVARQNGKGSILEARALAGLLLLDEKLIMWSAHEYKTSMEGFRRFRTLLRNLGERVNDNLIDIDGVLIKILNTNGEESFERLDTEQRVKFIARSKGSGRGFSGDVNIIDEAYAYTEDQHAALMPTMSAVANPQIIYTSSPPLDGDTGEILFALRKRAEAGGDDSLGWRDWGAAGDLDNLDKVDLDDRELWAATNPALGVRITEETIARERRSMSTNGGEKFARERLSIWPRERTSGGAIDPVLWASLADPESRRDGPVAIAVDIAPQRDYAAIGLYGLRADGFGHMQILDYRPGTDWILARIVEWRAALNPVGIGMGRAVAASLEVELEKLGIKRPEKDAEPHCGDLAVMNATEMSAATGQILDAVRQKTDRHIGQHELDASVAGAKARESGDSLAWARKESESDTSPLVSVTFARWAFTSLAHLVTEANYDVLESVW